MATRRARCGRRRLRAPLPNHPGPRAGHKVLTLRGAMAREAAPQQHLCADTGGFSRHAAVRCEAHDRKRLEQLCRDGTTHLVT